MTTDRVLCQVANRRRECLSDIGEQSLGFRWFFVYRLLTEYRRERTESSGVLFLFDEAASNLHSAAQSLLLESFDDWPKARMSSTQPIAITL